MLACSLACVLACLLALVLALVLACSRFCALGEAEAIGAKGEGKEGAREGSEPGATQETAETKG